MMKTVATLVGLATLVVSPSSAFGQVRGEPINGVPVPVRAAGPDPVDCPAQPPADVAGAVGELEQRVADVYERVSRAIVRWSDPQAARVDRSGVILTADGLVLIAATRKGRRLTFQLTDGRHVKGTTLGWSGDLDIGMARLDGPGPWPHVKLAETAVRVGQHLVTLGHATSEPPELFPRPLLGVGRVTESAVGHWFMTSDASTNIWRGPATAFDLDGNLVGFGWILWQGEKAVYTESNVLGTLRDRLVAGENLDLVRLGGARGRDDGDNDHRDSAPAVVPEAVEERAEAATVRIRLRREDRGFSGVVISPDGLVATCGHHFWLPGTAVIVSLPDGRDAPGRVVGVNLVCDIGLVRIAEPGPWPHVPRGLSSRLRAGDACLCTGYGPMESRDRQPSVRRSTVVDLVPGTWEYRLGTDPTMKLVGGDSGGGVFDVEGRLVAIHQQHAGLGPGQKPHPHLHARVELFDQHWEELNAPFEQCAGPAPDAPGTGLKPEEAKIVSGCVAEVLDGSKPVALGMVASPEGLILTKASNLPDVPTCRLSDGRTLPGSVVKISREHDLAVLKVNATDLSASRWSEAAVPRVGTIRVVLTPGGGIAPGFISHPPVSIPAKRGVLWMRVRDSAQGLEVAEVLRDFGLPTLREGDVVQSIDGNPVRELADYRKLTDPEQGSLVWVAGDRPNLVVARGETLIHLRPSTGPLSLSRTDGQSPRCSGFDMVYPMAMDARPPLGGPVVDGTGKVVGLAIAWRGPACLLVLPSSIVKGIVAKAAEESDAG